MMYSGLIYANARIKSLENNLLTTDKMLRMIDSVSLDEAVKVLIENNYGGGLVLDNPNNYDALLLAESQKTVDLIREIMPNGEGMEIFLLKIDYHNAKVLIKSKYLGSDGIKQNFENNGTLDSEKLQGYIMSDNYSSLYPEMKNALDIIDRAFASGDRSPRLIDTMLDKAYFKHCVIVVSKASPSIKKYLTALADLINFGSFIRCRRGELNSKFFSAGFVSGGEIKEDFFQSLFDASDEVVGEKFRYTSYKNLTSKALEIKNKALVEYETAMDNHLLEIFKADKHDMFSISPMAGYYIAKMTEIKVARTILVCIKNKVDRILIKQRLRELYA